MSFDISVECGTLPAGITSAWQQQIQLLGANIEFDPHFDPHSWGSGYLPLKLTVPSTSYLPASGRFGAQPLAAGFQARFDHDRALFWVSGGSNAADVYAQCLCAAALAILTNGKYSDPQLGEEAVGLGAAGIALEQLGRVAASAHTRWQLPRFESW